MTMSIEDYRNMKMTEREEWDANFNGKRCSIEALDTIITKKRGSGPEKPNYTHDSTEPGPYYDPQGIHLHIWKNKKHINNFTGEQKPNIKCVQYTEDKPGYYCSICHSRNTNAKFKWIQSPEKPLNPKNNENHIIYNTSAPTQDYIYFPPTVEIKEIKQVKPRCIRNWNTLMFKVVYILKFGKFEYKISNSKVLYLWPWELTSYQNFKLKYPNYKKYNIFLDDSNNLSETYAYII